MSNTEFLDIRQALKQIQNKKVNKLYKEYSALYSSIVVSQYLTIGELNIDQVKDKELEYRENMKCLDKSIYSGQVDEKNRRHGLGILLCSDKSLYIGFFKNSQHKGKGRLFSANGTVYEGKWSGQYIRGNAKIYYPDGRYYNGLVNFNIPHGLGEMSLPGKWKYSGPFLEGLKHGKGTLEKANHEKYSGDFYRDKIEGKGFFEYANGSKYQGEVKKGKIHGKGKLIKDSTEYEGEFIDGVKDGYGVMVYKTGKRFEGFFRNDRPDGKGKETREDGLIVEGLWKAGAMIECYNDAYEDPLDAYPAFNKVELADNFNELNDKVQASRAAKVRSVMDSESEDDNETELKTKNPVEIEPFSLVLEDVDQIPCLRVLSEIVITHSLYTKSVKLFKSLPLFEYQDNILEKEVKFCSIQCLQYHKKNLKFKNEWIATKNKDGGVYKGEVDMKGQFSGKGLLLLKGSIYQGYFNKNVREGHGREIYPNGSYYEGGWANNRKCGWGVERCEDGKVYSGDWEDNLKHGFGILICSNWKYEGLWEGDKKNGEGVMFFSDKSRYKGEFLDDKPHGYGCFIESNGHAVVGMWDCGKLVRNEKQETDQNTNMSSLSKTYSIPAELTFKSFKSSFPDSSMAANEFSIPDFNVLQDLQD